ncbi:MAG: hypothetical protein IKY52_13645, partial [Clostridia bacterium]|nr:hypothetical protein [Clostridia bacterium]
ANHPYIRYTGRWNVTESGAVSTANGNYAEFAFVGDTAVIGFDMEGCIFPVPHVYIAVDNGARVELPLEKYIRVSAVEGEHTVRIILKGSVETQNRWSHPMQAKTAIRTLEADTFLPLPEDNRKTIEFLGDSITEGISIDNNGKYIHYGSHLDMVFWDDSTAGYAWLTAEAMNLRPIIMGYGCLGTTRGGTGGIPPVCQSYPYYSDGCPMESANADFVVINHGTNDRGAEKEAFKKAYGELLALVRARNPKAEIIALTPFCGALAEEILEVVETFNRTGNDSVFYINTAGWIPPEPLHPTREGNKTVSRNLSEILRKKYNL